MVAVMMPAAPCMDFEQVYSANYDQVYGMVRRLTMSHEVAEDITAQTFLQAFEARDRYVDRGVPIAAWLCRIARNLVASHMRNRHPHTALDDSYEDGDDTPEEQVVRKLDAATVKTHIEQLRSDLQRQILTLHYCDGLAPSEMAERLGKSVTHVRVTEHRALANMRRLMQKRR